jgi:hypothetical protein
MEAPHVAGSITERRGTVPANYAVPVAPVRQLDNELPQLTGIETISHSEAISS